MSLSDYYNKTVVIHRLTQTEDNYGGHTNVYEEHIASYDCRIYKPKKEFAVADIGGKEKKTYTMAGGNADLKANDKVIDGDDEYIVTKVYKVYTATSIHHIECLIDKVK